MKQSNKRTTVVYLRLASACNLKIWVQETKVKNHLQKAGDTGNVTFFRDNGYSGCTLDRPALQAMLEQIKRGNVCTVVIASIDRLARSAILMGQLLRLFKAHGVELISLAKCADGSSIMESLEVLP